MQKNTSIRRLAFMVPIILGFAFTAKATGTPTLTMTEVSSTTLTYSWDGTTPQSGTATETSPDHWTFTINDAVVSYVIPGTPYNIDVQWEEPDYATSSLVNWVNFYQYGPAANGTVVTVISDNPLDPNHTYPTEDNGQIYTFPNPPAPSGNAVQFTDDGDTVPDGGATVGLLGMGLIGLASLRMRLARA
jgi:hypothetical protein